MEVSRPASPGSGEMTGEGTCQCGEETRSGLLNSSWRAHRRQTLGHGCQLWKEKSGAFEVTRGGCLTL